MKVLVAPNSFKHSINAITAAKAIAEGLKAGNPFIEPVESPIADGGDYTLEVLIEGLKGRFLETQILDPLGRPLLAKWGLAQGDSIAVIEFAKASGLHLLKKSEMNPEVASSFGAGLMIREALNRDVDELWLGIGGSATVDGGAGLLRALGFQFLDSENKPVDDGVHGLINLRKIVSPIHFPSMSTTKITILCDVDNPLLGENGAAKVFGPQKGAGPEMVDILEEALTRLSEVIRNKTGKDVSTVKHGGASGGVAAALFGLLDANLVSGSGFILKQLNFISRLSGCMLMITGEGRIDHSTFYGKAPAEAARIAKGLNVPVVALAGSLGTIPDGQTLFDAIFPIGSSTRSLEYPFQHTEEDLYRTSLQIAKMTQLFSIHPNHP